MKPLPVEHAATGKQPDDTMPPQSNPLSAPNAGYSNANNRRSHSNPLDRSYPWLLAASTLIAAAFCVLYITKPVIVQSDGHDEQTGPGPALSHGDPIANPSASANPLMPGTSQLPGESTRTQAATKPLRNPSASPAFEETNLRIQHVLAAETPDGPVARIDIDVPVLYQSRNLRWSSADVAEARNLMLRLMDYQEKSRNLRSEGIDLLTEWKTLVNKSTPATALRADSPSLPVNQQWAADSPLPATLNTGASVKLQPAGK